MLSLRESDYELYSTGAILYVILYTVPSIFSETTVLYSYSSTLGSGKWCSNGKSALWVQLDSALQYCTVL